MNSFSVSPNVIVITGASSGIGRAIALAFAPRKHTLVLASRDQAALAEVAAECVMLGARTEIIPTDVSVEEQVEALASRAIGMFGRIDIWINCAAVLAFGHFETLPTQQVRRVIDVNLMGAIYGSRAAINTFHGQANRGTLINVASMLSLFGEPIRGFTASLRQEMSSYPAIHVCTVLPVAIDTPIYQKAANAMGRPARSIAPLYGADIVARTILKLPGQPRAEVIAGHYGYLLDVLNRLSPVLVSHLSAWLAPKVQFKEGTADVTDGNLFESRGPHSTEGGWRRYWMKRLFRFR